MRLVELAHLHLRPVLQVGDSVLDATAGNGHDALFLAQAVGAGGVVHAFDLQPQALERTRARLAEAGLEACLRTHLCSHAQMAQCVPSGLRAAMFNLGYLPGAAHELITQPEESLRALQAALDLLRPGGRISLICYPGHDGGDQEYELLSQFLYQLPAKLYRVFLSSCFNASASAPQLFTLTSLCHE